MSREPKHCLDPILPCLVQGGAAAAEGIETMAADAAKVMGTEHPSSKKDD